MASDDSPADHLRRSHPNLPRTPPPEPKRPGIPPFYPHVPTPVPATAGGQLHARSLSQPASFSFDALPPLSPAPPRELPASSSLSDPIAGADAAVDDSAGSAPSFAARPPRKTHRRSASDMSSCSFSGADALSGGLPAFVKSEGQGVGDDLFAAFLNLDFINSGDFLENRDDMDSGASGTKHNREDSSENEVESSMEVSDGSLEKKGSQKRSFGAVGGPRHSRSLSVDSFMGNLPNFSDELLRLPPSPSPGVASGQHSRSNSFDGSSNLFGIDQGSGDFSGADIKKIMANEKLAEIAASDPKRAKRILANRQSAARSKERKMRYISELENKVQTLQTEATTLSTQLTMLQRDSAGLNSQNNELRFRLQSMEQQAQLRDALNEALTSEVRHLKLAAQDITTSISNNRMGQQVHGHSQLYPMLQQPMQPFYQIQQQHLQPMQQMSQTPQQQEQLKQQPPEQSQQHPNSPATMREQDK